jgi:hypothetical protein
MSTEMSGLIHSGQSSSRQDGISQGSNRVVFTRVSVRRIIFQSRDTIPENPELFVNSKLLRDFSRIL